MQRGRGFVRAAFSFAKFAASGKVKLDSADKSDTVSFAYPPLGGGSRSARTHPKRKRGRANAVSKELGENRFKQLVKKIGQDKAMEMLKGAPL